ncbi:LOW QUALITY PROTEIN: T-cell surface glycoprotein CD3 gamma chain [Lates calcarifer]|uniref:LOW QUALITY PROTEIN: T-cell surface glycoprotein CD3 gamma chain n=1 Tax=Lates calcarifer TaxID=8187 RepID=A0AAJ7VAA0_LATCA|nr:LOW QUALITY PROTEIN: T-cell surface glycoprotein CD3 gamma chain [Lates calcarifer]
MKCQVVFPACLLLLWTLAVFVSAQETPKITTLMTSDGIKLKCGTDGYFKKDGQNHPDILQYNDENSGEYTCWTANPANEDGERKGPKIFVRFRTCDNCIELDIGSVVGMVVGNMVATTVIGVAVYLIASHGQSGQQYKRMHDRPRIDPNDGSGSRGGSSDHYQRLRYKGGQKDVYDQINKK